MELEDEARQITLERIPCQFCTRKFVPESLAKHAKVCEKMLHKKRRTFDSAKQRIQGTELAEFLPVVTKKNDIMTSSQCKEKPSVPVKIIDSVLHVPTRKINKVTSPMSKSSNYEKCPYCDRSFGPKAFDRHIEWCKEQSIRINLKCSATQEAKERLEARIKYRAPSFKSKRSITREKYSPKISHQDNLSFSNRNEAKKDEMFIKPFELESKAKSKSMEKLRPKENKDTNFIRQNVLRCSYRSKLPKKPETKAEKDTLNNNFQNKKKTEYNVVQDWISANGTKIKPTSQSSKMSTNCVNKPLLNVMCETYNPYILAEHQMKELLNDVNANVEKPFNETFTIAKLDTSNSPLPSKDRNNFHNKENISYDHGPVKTISCQTDGTDKTEKYFKTSPTSAFTRYNGSPELNRTLTPIPSYDYDTSDDTYLPPITKQESVQTNHDTNMNRYPFISLSNLSLCSSVSIDIAEDRGKTCKSADKPRNNDVQLVQRSISACNGDKGNKNSIKKNLKMEHLLYGNTEPKEMNSTFVKDSYASKYDEKLEKLNSLLDGENFDLLNSFTEFENVLQSSCFDDTFATNSDSSNDKRNLKLERGDSMVSKMSIDSAYNSLNRKSPALSESNKYYEKTSTPETDTLKSSTFSLASDFQDSNSQAHKLSKFCHECGARFPLDIAKFCCECGVRRLVL